MNHNINKTYIMSYILWVIRLNVVKSFTFIVFI